MNNVSLIGRIGWMDQMKQKGAKNSDMLAFSIAISEKRGNDQHTHWINCVAWNKTAEIIAQYFSKGQRIGVVGSLKYSDWKGKDGSKQSAIKVRVREITFIELKDGGNNGNYNQAPQNNYNPNQGLSKEQAMSQDEISHVDYNDKEEPVDFGEVPF